MSTATNALVPAGSGAIVVPNAMAALGLREDQVFKPSMVRLIQPINSTEDRTAGLFYDEESGTPFDKMQIVPLEIRKQRVYFPPGETISKEPLCRSTDGICPAIYDNLIPQASSCAECEFSKWGKLNGKGGKVVPIKPACNDTRVLTFLEAETGFIYRFAGKGSQVKPLDGLANTLWKRVIRERNLRQDANFNHYGLTLVMGATKVTNTKGTFYVVTFGPPQVIEDPAEFGPIYEKVVLRQFSQPEQVDAAITNDFVDA